MNYDPSHPYYTFIVDCTVPLLVICDNTGDRINVGDEVKLEGFPMVSLTLSEKVLNVPSLPPEKWIGNTGDTNR